MTAPLCGLVEAACVCGEPAGHVEAGQQVHKCSDHGLCRGEWIVVGDSIEVVVYPGGFRTYEEALADLLGGDS